jgi:GNAT superfamily N-acetyltransferase
VTEAPLTGSATGLARDGAPALAGLLDGVAAGRFPPADGSVTILPQPSPRDAGVISFTGHTVIFTDADPAWVAGLLPDRNLASPLRARFLHALAERTGRTSHSVTLLCLAGPLPGPPPIRLTPTADPDHPRIARSRRYRDEVRAWQADGGMMVLGRGVAERWEVGIEVSPDCRGRGLGQMLAAAARHVVADGGPIWAQIAAGNVASLRAFLAAGYAPVAAEALLLLD